MPSANTVLGKLHRPALEGWKFKAIAARLAEDRKLLNMARRGDTWRAARTAIDSMPTDKADLGTAVHLATEVYDVTNDVGEAMFAVEREVGSWERSRQEWVSLDNVRQHLDRWVETRHEYGIIPVDIEVTVAHKDIQYAGTMDRTVGFVDDAVADLFHEGCRLAHVLDVKTGKDIYPDVALQLSGYANATHSWNYRNDSVTPLVGVCKEVGIVASLHADRCKLVTADLRSAFATFAAAMRAWLWAERDSHEVLGEPVPSPATERPW